MIHNITSTSSSSSSSSIEERPSEQEEEEEEELCQAMSDNDDYYYSETDSEADLDLQIDFLKRKSALLERACRAMREDTEYDATVAREECVEPEESPLWSEAKEVLREVYRGEPGPDLFQEEGNSNSNGINNNNNDNSKKRKNVQFLGDEDAYCPGPAKERKSPKHPRIDLSSVRLISKADPGNASHSKQTIMDLGDYSKSMNRTSLEMKGKEQQESNQWMTDLLKQTKLSSLYFNGTDEDMGGSMNLMEATALSPRPQLVMDSHPPFHVVHANRAFCILSGISTNEVIGKSIESILKRSQQQQRFIQSSSTKSGCCDAYFDSVLDCWASEPTHDIDTRNWIPQRVCKACEAHLVPIVDRSKCAKLNPNHESLISHLLLQFKESNGGIASSSSNFSSSCNSASERQSRSDSQTSSSSNSNYSRESLSPPPPPSRRMELIG